MQNALCGSQLTTTNADLNADGGKFYVGDSLPSVSVGYCYTPQPTTYFWPYQTTYTDPRIAALEAKVETLEKMLAAVISGVKTGGANPRARKGGGSI